LKIEEYKRQHLKCKECRRRHFRYLCLFQ